MKYVTQEKLKEYVSNGDFDKAIKSYKIDDDRNLVIVSWSRKEDGSVELTTNNSMSIKTTLSRTIKKSLEKLKQYEMNFDDTLSLNFSSGEDKDTEII